MSAVGHCTFTLSCGLSLNWSKLGICQNKNVMLWSLWLNYREGMILSHKLLGKKSHVVHGEDGWNHKLEKHTVKFIPLSRLSASNRTHRYPLSKCAFSVFFYSRSPHHFQRIRVEKMPCLPMWKKVRWKKIINPSLLFALNVNWVYSGLRPILHPSFVEIVSAGFCVILLTNQDTDGGEDITSLIELKMAIRSFPPLMVGRRHLIVYNHLIRCQSKQEHHTLNMWPLLAWNGSPAPFFLEGFLGFVQLRQIIFISWH